MESQRERVPPGQGVTNGFPVLHVGVVPAFDAKAWRLSIGGAVTRPCTLTWAEFEGWPRCETRADFHCVTGWSRLDIRWEGVALAEIARRVGLSPAARFLRFADPQGFDTTVPIERALAEGLLADRHDGAALAPEHGAPLRAVIPSLYGWKSCKWVCELEFLEHERLGFWEQRGYHNGADPWCEQRLV